MNPRDLGWLEGIIDGEGSLGLYKRQEKACVNQGFTWIPRLAVEATSNEMIQRVREVVGEGAIYNRPARTPQNKATYLYIASSNTLRTLLPQLQLTVKDGQRVLLVEALGIITRNGRLRSNYGRLEDIHQELRALNQKGKRLTT